MFYLFNLFNPILIAAAVVPALFLMYKIYKADRLEPESPRTLLGLAGLGVVSTVVAMILENIGGTVVSRLFGNSSAYELIFYFIVVALSEEGAKYFFLRRRTWFSNQFNCQFDGVVYAVFVSLGFALAENVGYVMRYGLGTALARAVTAIPGHACFGVFMGAFYGIAKRYDNFGYPEKSSRMSVLALLLPALLHGTYDYIATRSGGGGTLIFVIFIAAMFLAAFKLVQDLSGRDRYIY